MRRIGFVSRVSLLASLVGLVAACSSTAPNSRRGPKAAASADTAARPGSLEDLFHGWSLEQRVNADLNRDARDDAVVLLRRTADGGGHERTLAVALQDIGGDYKLIESNARV